MIGAAIVEMDTHGLTAEQAVRRIDNVIKKAGSGTYRIRVIHGFNRGNVIQQAIYREFGHGLCEKVIRIMGGSNPGITELVLREY